MRWRYFWPLLAVNVAVDAEIVAHTLLPTPAAIGGLIGIFARSVAVWALPHWWPRRSSHESRAGAVWWTLRHPRRRLWMWRHGWSLAHQYEAEKRAEWDRVKTQAIGAELQRQPLPVPEALDAIPHATSEMQNRSPVDAWNEVEDYSGVQKNYGDSWRDLWPLGSVVRINSTEDRRYSYMWCDNMYGTITSVRKNPVTEEVELVVALSCGRVNIRAKYCTTIKRP